MQPLQVVNQTIGVRNVDNPQDPIRPQGVHAVGFRPVNEDVT